MQEIFKISPNFLNAVILAWVVFLFIVFWTKKTPKFLWPLNFILFIIYTSYFFCDSFLKKDYLSVFIFLLIIFWMIIFELLKKFKMSNFEMIKKIFLIILLIFVAFCFFKGLCWYGTLLLIMAAIKKNNN